METKETSRKTPIVVAMLNAAGGSGKSTCDASYIAPKLNARRVAVEEINKGVGHYDLEVSLGEFEDVVVAMKKNRDRNVVLDIGASTASGITEVLARYPRTLQSINWWIIPTKPNDHSRHGAIKAVSILRELGVPADRILVLPNDVTPSRSQRRDAWRDDFRDIYALRDFGIHVSSEPIWHSPMIAAFGDPHRTDLKNSDEGSPETVWTVAHGRTYEQIKDLLCAAQDADDSVAEDRWAQRLADFEACEAILRNFEAVWARLPVAARVDPLQEALDSASAVAIAE